MEGTKLTGLWKGKTKQGKTILSGPVNAVSRLLVLPNDYKRGERDPDYFVFLVPQKTKERSAPPTPEGEDDL